MKTGASSYLKKERWARLILTISIVRESALERVWVGLAALLII